MVEHGVLCVGQVLPTPQGTLELIYTSTDTLSDAACASDASAGVNAKTRLFDGTYSYSAVAMSSEQSAEIKSRIGKVNNFRVTSLYNNADTFAAGVCTDVCICESMIVRP